MIKRVLNRNEVLVFSILIFQIAKAIWNGFTESMLLQGRVDDNIDTIRKRLKVFAASHYPVIDYYLKKGSYTR